jgi:hypothetical protein
MSTIAPHLYANRLVSADPSKSILVAGLLCGIELVLGMIVVVGMAAYSSGAGSMDVVNICRAQIIGFEQKGYYSSTEEFKTAESFCYSK